MATAAQIKHRESIDPLLPDNTEKSNESKIKNRININICNVLLCPLNLITYPLIYLLDGLSCWENKKYQQHDLSFQFIGLFQNLVAVFWSNSLFSMIEYILNKDESLNVKDIRILLLIRVSYTTIMYLFSIFIIYFIPKFKFLSERITFFIGLFVRIIAFGVKDLGFQIHDIYFSNSFQSALSFFFIQLFCAIIILISLSTLRSKLCPNRYVRKQESNHNKKNKQRCSEDHKSHQSLGMIAKKQRHKQLYEKRLKNKMRKMEFNKLINTLDSDCLTISLGFCLVAAVICGLNGGKWIPLRPSIIHDSSIRDIHAIYFIYLFVSLCIIWIIWLHFIAWFEMIRDRAYQKVFLMANYVQIGQTNINRYYDDYIIQYTNVLLKDDETGNKLFRNNSDKQNRFNFSNLLPQKAPTLDIKESNAKSYLIFPKRLSPTGQHVTHAQPTNKTNNISSNNLSSPEYPNFGSTSSFHRLSFSYRLLFQSGFKYKNAMDRFVEFITGILGWSMGWSMAGAIYVTINHEYRLIYALCATIACIVLEICRNLYVHKNINLWYEVSKRRRRLYRQTVHDIYAQQTSLDIKFYEDTVDMTDFDEFENAKQKLKEETNKLDIRRQRVILAATSVLPEDEEIELENTKELSLTCNSIVSTSYMEERPTIPFINRSPEVEAVSISIKRMQTAITESGRSPLYRASPSGFDVIDYLRRKSTVLTRHHSASTYLSSNVDIASPRKRHINLGIMSNSEHKSVYLYNHISVTWRKSLGLVLAIVWAATVISLLNAQFTNYQAIKYNIFLTVIITIIGAYLGMRFTEIKRKYAGYSNADITKRFIQSYHEDVLQTRQNIANKFELD